MEGAVFNRKLLLLLMMLLSGIAVVAMSKTAQSATPPWTGSACGPGTVEAGQVTYRPVRSDHGQVG